MQAQLTDVHGTHTQDTTRPSSTHVHADTDTRQSLGNRLFDTFMTLYRTETFN